MRSLEAHDIVNALDTHVFKFTPTHTTTNPILTVVDKVFISFVNFKHDDQVRIARQVCDILETKFNHVCDVVKYNTTEFVVQTDMSRFNVMMATDQFKFRWEDIMLHVDDGRMWFSDGQGRIKNINIGVATDHQPCIPWLKQE